MKKMIYVFCCMGLLSGFLYSSDGASGYITGDEGFELVDSGAIIVVPENVTFDTTPEQDAQLAQAVAALNIEQEKIRQQLLLQDNLQDAFQDWNPEDEPLNLDRNDWVSLEQVDHELMNILTGSSVYVPGMHDAKRKSILKQPDVKKNKAKNDKRVHFYSAGNPIMPHQPVTKKRNDGDVNKKREKRIKQAGSDEKKKKQLEVDRQNNMKKYPEELLEVKRTAIEGITAHGYYPAKLLSGEFNEEAYGEDASIDPWWIAEHNKELKTMSQEQYDTQVNRDKIVMQFMRFLSAVDKEKFARFLVNKYQNEIRKYTKQKAFNWQMNARFVRRMLV